MGNCAGRGGSTENLTDETKRPFRRSLRGSSKKTTAKKAATAEEHARTAAEIQTPRAEGKKFGKAAEKPTESAAKRPVQSAADVQVQTTAIRPGSQQGSRRQAEKQPATANPAQVTPGDSVKNTTTWSADESEKRGGGVNRKPTAADISGRKKSSDHVPAVQNASPPNVMQQQSVKQPANAELARKKKEKTEVKIVCGDLLECEAEVLVSPSNCELRPRGGVAKAIMDAAGQSVEKQCKDLVTNRNRALKATEAVYTSAGDLKAPIRHIIHVVGPRRDDYSDHSLLHDAMVRTFLNCLRIANETLKVSSVAFPALGAGTNRVPIDTVVRSARDAVAAFDDTLATSNAVRTIRTVYFVNLDEVATQNFEECFSTNRLTQFPARVDSPPAVSGGARLTEKLPVEDYLWRYMEKYRKSDLDKICNTSASYTYHFASHELQITSTNGISVRRIFEKVDDMVKNLRTEVGIISEAVPPAVDIDAFKNVAKSVADREMSIFYVDEATGECCVVGPKERINRVVKTIKKMIGDDQRAIGGRCVQAQPEDIVKLTTRGGIEVKIYRQDLLLERVDAIVNPANVDLSHGGGAAKAIADAAGKQLRDECKLYKKNYGKLHLSQVMYTTAGNLCPNIQYVIHAAGPPADEFKDWRQLSNCVRDTFYNCLHFAGNDLKITSVSIPAISSGIFGVPKETVAWAAHEALMKFDAEIQTSKKKSSLTEVRFVNIDEETTAVFQSTFLEAFRDRPTTRDDASEVQRQTSKKQRSLVTAAAAAADSSSSRSPKDADRQSSVVTGSESPTIDQSPMKRRDQRTSSMPATSRRKTKQAGPPMDCVICMCPITNPKTLPCGHTFCVDCIQQSFDKCSPKCPSCGRLYGVMKGNQPPGTTKVKKSKIQLAGYEGCGAIVIEYDIPGGIQQNCHPNPGQPFYGTHRAAYLPDNDEGRKVCQLLQQAFDAGLIFTVGRSNTTGNDNMVIWNDIHHKTSPTGQYGYPDPSYLTRVKDELAAKGITG